MQSAACQNTASNKRGFYGPKHGSKRARKKLFKTIRESDTVETAALN